MMGKEGEQYDAHVVKTKKLFRDSGMMISAMRYPRPHDSLLALCGFNGLKDVSKAPVAWHYHPNEYLRDRWLEKGAL